MSGLDVALSLDELLELAEKNPDFRPEAAKAIRSNPEFGRRMHWEVWAQGLDHGLNHKKWQWDVELIAPRTMHLHLVYYPPGAGYISGHITATGVLYSDGSSYHQSRPTLRSMVDEIAGQVEDPE